MKKKLLSLVLAVMMTVGCFAGLGAAVGQDADFAALSVENQYAAIMAAGSEADAQALFDTLDAEQQAALTAYADRQQENTDTSKETDPIPAVNYTNVAPLVTANKVSQPAKARLMSASSTARPIEKGKTVDGLVMDKTATANDDGTYNITLEAYTTGSVSTTESTKPTDIVLVLDKSGSMSNNMTSYTYTERYNLDRSSSYYVKSNGGFVEVDWCSDCRAWTNGCYDSGFIFTSHHAGSKFVPMTSASDAASGHVQFYSRGNATTVRRLTALKNAVNNFTNSVAEKAKGADGILGTDDDINFRIAVVSFADRASNLTNGLVNMDDRNGVSTVNRAVNGINASGNTYPANGLNTANSIFSANSVDLSQRNRVVVLFTDGYPAEGGTDNINYGLCDSAIASAYTSKNTYGATVYTVGIFAGADPESDINTNFEYGNRYDSTLNTKQLVAANRYMQYTSSNYPNAQSLKNGGDMVRDGYYLSASDSDTLNTIFQKISEQFSESDISLGSQTVIKDTVTKYFDMPTDASKVSVKSYDCTGVVSGKPTWSETGTVINNAVTLDQTDNSVNVTGFDFNANYVTEKGRDETNPKKEGTFHGRKLVIEFTVTAKDGFVGGNNVPTNGTDSGVYDKDGKEVATFDVPQVNVPIKSELTVNDKVIYEGGSADVSGLYNAADTSSWKYDFVKVSYEVKNGDTAVTGSVSPADCTDYTVKATFSPKYDGKNADGKINDDVTVDDTATVHVLKPTVTVNATDVWMYYGEDYNTPEGSAVTGSVTWADERGHDINGITVIGSEPYGTDNLQYSYDHGQFVVPNTDTTIKVSAKVDGVEKASTSYVVHPKFCTLTIKKEVAKLYGANDSFIFNVVGEGNIKYEAKVVINGAGSAMLTGLPVGNYTVTEDSGWSWRYTCDSSTKSTVLSSAKDNDSVTITNKLDDNKYLGDETYVINKCESSTITKVTSAVIRQAIEYILGR